MTVRRYLAAYREVAPMANSAGTLHEQLARWTAEGLIDASQAGRIEAAETARVALAPRRRLPLVAEILGYVGAVVAVTAGIITVHQVFRHVPPAAELAIAAVAAAGLLVAGAAVPAAREPALSRLRSVLWLLATAATAAFAAILANEFLHLPGRDTALIAAAAGLACAAPLYWRNRSVAQHLALAAGTAGVIEAGISRIDPHASSFWFGFALWLLAAAWGAATWRGYLKPTFIGLPLAGVGLLTGAMIAMEAAAGQALAMVTVAGLFVTGVLTRRVLPIVFGAIGTILIVPAVAQRYLPGSVWAPLSVAVAGLVLCGAAIWLARSHRTARP